MPTTIYNKTARSYPGINYVKADPTQTYKGSFSNKFISLEILSLFGHLFNNHLLKRKEKLSTFALNSLT